jgi:CheY-like chemotaxis protein
MKKRHILIVDSDQNTLRSMEFVLEAANYKITATANSREALERIASARNRCCLVELLIADIQLPGLNGVELTGELNRQNIELPTLVISAYNNQELQSELARLGLTTCSSSLSMKRRYSGVSTNFLSRGTNNRRSISLGPSTVPAVPMSAWRRTR